MTLPSSRHGGALCHPAHAMTAVNPVSIAQRPPGDRVWIVPHTHWDREWYLPFEQFRMRLVRIVAELVEVMEDDLRIGHFTLDGQAVILEDVAELRPELSPRLGALAD